MQLAYNASKLWGDFQVTRSPALETGQPAPALAGGEAGGLAASLAGGADHFPRPFALLAVDFPCTPATFASHHQMSLAATLADRTFDKTRGLTPGTVDPSVAFASRTDTIT